MDEGKGGNRHHVKDQEINGLMKKKSRSPTKGGAIMAHRGGGGGKKSPKRMVKGKSGIKSVTVD